MNALLDEQRNWELGRVPERDIEPYDEPEYDEDDEDAREEKRRERESDLEPVSVDAAVEALREILYQSHDECPVQVLGVESNGRFDTFADFGYLTGDKGVIIELENGQRVLLTVQVQ